VLTHLRVNSPRLDDVLSDASIEKRLAKRQLGDGRPKPVAALGECLEWRCRRVHGVVSRVGLGRKAKRLPVAHDHAAKRISRGGGWVGGAKNLLKKKRLIQ